MNELIPSIMWVCPLVFAFGTQLYYLIHNEELVLFIRNWRELEVELNSLPNYKDQHERSQKIYSAVYLTKLILQCCLLTLYIALLIIPQSSYEHQQLQLQQEEKDHHGWWTLPANVTSSRQLFMMHYKELCHYAHHIFFAMVHIVSMIFATVFVPLADLVPSLVYCHAATAVHALQNAIQLVDSNLNNLKTAGFEPGRRGTGTATTATNRIGSSPHFLVVRRNSGNGQTNRQSFRFHRRLQSRTDLLHDLHIRIFARLLEGGPRLQFGNASGHSHCFRHPNNNFFEAHGPSALVF